MRDFENASVPGRGSRYRNPKKFSALLHRSDLLVLTVHQLVLLTEIWDFQILLTSDGLHVVRSSALNLDQLLQLGKLEQGEITTLSKF